jgi:hypothetical protein
MTHPEERQGERGGGSARPSDFMMEGQNRFEDIADAQAQFLDRLQDTNRKWFDRLQDEASMAADFANRLTAAKSLTETAHLFQDWTVRHWEMATEDARRMFNDTQDIVAAGARMWTDMGARAGGDGDGRRSGPNH